MSEIENIQSGLSGSDHIDQENYYPLIRQIQSDLNKRGHDFYRCYKCGSLFTREDERMIFEAGNSGEMDESHAFVCDCGSAKYVPAIPNKSEWEAPHIMAYTAKLILARAVVPAIAEEHPDALEHIEWLLASGLIEEHAEKAWPLIEAIVKEKAKHTATRPKREESDV